MLVLLLAKSRRFAVKSQPGDKDHVGRGLQAFVETSEGLLRSPEMELEETLGKDGGCGFGDLELAAFERTLF